MYRATKLTEKGYRRVSNRYRTVARVDRSDWKKALAIIHAPWDPWRVGMPWVENMGRSAADFYRRCCSKDKISGLPEEVFKHIPGSGHDPVGYIPLTKENDMGKIKVVFDENPKKHQAKIGELEYGTIFTYSGQVGSIYSKMSARERDIGKGVTINKPKGTSLCFNLKLGSTRYIPGDTIVDVMDADLHLTKTENVREHKKDHY